MSERQVDCIKRDMEDVVLKLVLRFCYVIIIARNYITSQWICGIFDHFYVISLVYTNMLL